MMLASSATKSMPPARRQASWRQVYRIKNSERQQHYAQEQCFQIQDKKSNKQLRPHEEERPGTSTCDSLIVNNQTLDFKLRWVERCLVQLVEEESRDNRATNGGPYEIEWTARFNRDRTRIKVMLQIYAKLLRCPPPPLSLIMETPACLQDARQQVLNLIERLAGYCDSINSLRCIIKSDQIIAVISAFDAILERIRDVSSHRCELVPIVEDSHEFRIVQEWRF